MENFSLGTSSRHHNNAGNSQQVQFRVSPVNLGNGRQSNNNSSQPIFNSVSSAIFGSAILPNSIFGQRAVNSSSFQTNPTNHFNFPLRSNTVSNRPTYANGNATNVNAGIGYQTSKNRGTNFNKTRQQNYQTNAIINSNGNLQPQNNSKAMASGNANARRDSSNANPEQEVQFRIFKRGDSIPGIISPIAIVSGSNSSDTADDPSGSKVGLSTSEEDGTKITASDGESSGNKNNKENAKDKESKDDDQRKNQPNKTSVSIVSDIARFHNLNIEYRLVAEKGPPHNPTFTVALHGIDANDVYIGQGSSIKRAQHQAAQVCLEQTELSRPSPRSQQKRSFGTGGKRPNWALLQLTTLAEELKEPISIVQQPITIIDPFRRGDPPSIVSVHVGERIFTGEGSNFNAAKNLAAMIALKAMLKVKQEFEQKKMAEYGDESLENKSPISVVHEMAMKRGLCVKFNVTKEEGPPHNKVFTVVCSLDGGNNSSNSMSLEEHSAEGQGPTKQAAKKVASELMMEKLNDIPAITSNLQAGSIKSIQRGLYRQKLPRRKTSAPVVKDLEKQTVSPISRLIQIAHIRKYKEPEFYLVASSTSANDEAAASALKAMSERERRIIRKKKPSFTIEVAVGPHCCRGVGPNKKMAKKAAAEAALIELGYGPTEPAKDSTIGSGANEKKQLKGSHSNGDRGSSSKFGENGRHFNGNAITSARQIVPGVILLNSENKDSAGGSPIKNSASLAQEMVKVNSMSPGASSGTVTVRDGCEKLAYLARLLDVQVSYSDFPKKNEFLSVVSLGTNPPHVAHGCGSTLDEAQNAAATKILEELSDMGLDNVKSPNENTT